MQSADQALQLPCHDGVYLKLWSNAKSSKFFVKGAFYNKRNVSKTQGQYLPKYETGKTQRKDKWTPKVGEKELQLPAYFTE